MKVKLLASLWERLTLYLLFSAVWGTTGKRERAVTMATDETATQRLYSVLQMARAKFSTKGQRPIQALLRKGKL